MSRHSQTRVSQAHAVQPPKPSRTAPAHRNASNPKMGNQATQRLLRKGVIQAKLTVNQPGDRFEQEADRVAEIVMGMPDSAARVVRPSSEPRVVQRVCIECAEELHRKPRPGVEAVGEGFEHPRTGGRPLQDSERAFFEPRFGQDFNQVRLHTDAKASEAARSVNALAYTMGSHVVFGEGQYRPGTNVGRNLLAHELMHVLQQQARAHTLPLVQRQQRRTRVALATTGACANPRAIAEAIPGARAMANTAVNWFLSFTARDRARVDLLLRANFLSDSEDTRDVVENRILRIRALLTEAQNGNITFDCVPATDLECGGRNGYVRRGERGIVHLCPPFFGLTLEERRWMLVHECAHLVGAMVLPEHYYAYIGPVSEGNCRQLTPASSASEALGTADNYARLVWCLTKPPGTVITPP